jgi:hypothetical protein
VRGPDGEWYAVATAPPLGAVPLDRRQGVVDLGNPDAGLAVITGGLIGLTGGSTQPSSRPAPPDAYDYIHLDEDGYPVAGPGVTGHSTTPGSLPPDDAPDYPVERRRDGRPWLNPGGMSLMGVVASLGEWVRMVPSCWQVSTRMSRTGEFYA